MICRSFIPSSVEDVIQVLKSVTLAEIRLENIKNLTFNNLIKICSLNAKIVATCRPGTMSDLDRAQVLKWAAKAKADFIDVEIESDFKFLQDVISTAKVEGVEIIVSYHNYDMTPDAATLKDIVNDCFKKGATIAKVACMVNSKMDAARIMALADDQRQILPLGMGKLGAITRIAAPLLGAPFTFAPLNDDQKTAPGQLSAKTLQSIYNLLFCMS